MNLYIHTGLELMSAAMIAYVALMVYKTYKGMQTSSTVTLIGALGICAISDTVHALEAVSNFNLIPLWVPFTWGVSRFVLGLGLILTAIYAKLKPNIETGFVTVGLLAVLCSVLFSSPLFFYDYAVWMMNNDYIISQGAISRPMDFGLFLVWMAMLMSMWGGGEAKVIFPRGFRWFIGLGATTHLIMIFSNHALSSAAFIAHCTKLFEYGVWGYFAHIDQRQVARVGTSMFKVIRHGEQIQELDRIIKACGELAEQEKHGARSKPSNRHLKRAC